MEDHGKRRWESWGMVVENGEEALMDHGEQMVAEMAHYVGLCAVEPRMDHEEVVHDVGQMRVHVEVAHDVELELDLAAVLLVQWQALDHALQQLVHVQQVQDEFV